MIEVRHLKKSYGKKLVLEDISFQAQPGEMVVIVGRNGCGKSTLLQILAGAIPPDSGEIRYFDACPLKNKKMFRTYCGYVPQENPLMEELSVLDNLRLWGFRKSHPDAVILQQFGLEELQNRRVEQLSGGMKRRVSIACAAIAHPPVMLMDEPTTALDFCYREEIRRWMRLYCQRGGIIVMTTHEEAEMMEAQHCLVMNAGTLYELEDHERNEMHRNCEGTEQLRCMMNMTREEPNDGK